MTVKYEQSGIRFLYPDNWTVADDQTDERTRSVLVQAPSGAFWSVDLHRRENDWRTLATRVLHSMQQEYADLESEPVEDHIGGCEATGYDMQFCCLDFVVTARVRTLQTDAGTFVLLCQAEDRDFEELEPVFRAMSESMFRDLESDS